MAEKVVEGRCMSCKKQMKMVGWNVVEMKNGRKAVKGKCKECGTGMYKILSNADAEILSK